MKSELTKVHFVQIAGTQKTLFALTSDGCIYYKRYHFGGATHGWASPWEIMPSPERIKDVTLAKEQAP